MKEDTLGIALVHELCRVCGKPTNEHIIMNQRLTEKNAKDIESLHKKAIGYSDEPCDECSELMTKGFIFIEYDERLTTDKNNPYRTGNMWVVTFESAQKLDMSTETYVNGYAMIDIDTAKKIGLHKTE